MASRTPPTPAACGRLIGDAQEQALAASGQVAAYSEASANYGIPDQMAAARPVPADGCHVPSPAPPASCASSGKPPATGSTLENRFPAPVRSSSDRAGGRRSTLADSARRLETPLVSGWRERQADDELAAVGPVDHGDLALVCFDDPAGNGKPQPGAAV